MNTCSHLRRPSKAQLSRLEAENQQLRQQIIARGLRSKSASTPPEVITSDPRQESQESQDPPPIGDIPRRPEVGKQVPSIDQARSTVSRIFISPNGDSSYHGLTSTLFDDAPLDRRSQMRSTAPHVPVEHIQKRLMGESAYQRKSNRPIITGRILLYPRAVRDDEYAGGEARL